MHRFHLIFIITCTYKCVTLILMAWRHVSCWAGPVDSPDDQLRIVDDICAAGSLPLLIEQSHQQRNRILAHARLRMRKRRQLHFRRCRPEFASSKPTIDKSPGTDKPDSTEQHRAAERPAHRYSRRLPSVVRSVSRPAAASSASAGFVAFLLRRIAKQIIRLQRQLRAPEAAHESPAFGSTP